MGQLSGKIAETAWGLATNQLDYTEVYIKESPQSPRAHNRKYSKKGFDKKSLPACRALPSSYHRSLDV